MTAGAAFSALVLAASSWQVARSEKAAARLSAHLVAIQSARAASVSAVRTTELPDAVQTLPVAPSVAEVVQTLHRAAATEGADVISVQAEDQPPTPSTLGHLDIVLTVRAPYPSLLVVIRQVLDRYPGATLRQMTVAPVASGAPLPAMSASAAQGMTESEAHLTLALWRRPSGVDMLGEDAAGLPMPLGPLAGAASVPTQ